MNKTDVTIIIPHMDGELANKGLLLCLESLKVSGFPMDHVIVAHNGMMGSGGLGFNDVKTIWVEEQGQCKAVNAAAATVSTPWMMVSNNDMVYSKYWFELLTQYINKEVCISPQLIEPNDGAPTFKKVFCGGLGGDWNEQKFLDYCSEHVGFGMRPGFNLPFLLRKDVWDMVGGYDVMYDPWGSNSDSDLEYKLKLSGIQPYQQTDCPVYHFSQTSGTFEPKYRSYWEKNWNYFIEKWGFPRTDEGIWQATFEIPKEKLIFHPFWEGFYSRNETV